MVFHSHGAGRRLYGRARLYHSVTVRFWPKADACCTATHRLKSAIRWQPARGFEPSSPPPLGPKIRTFKLGGRENDRRRPKYPGLRAFGSEIGWKRAAKL